jgi:rhomboid protease GluP
VLAAVWPGLHPWLARDGLATLHGQLWRLVTPVLVQPGPVALVVVLFVLVALVAWPAERWFGSARMATLYLVGTVAGDIAGIWWDPQGAGIAIAGCGVLGGFAVWWLRMRRSGPVSAGLWVIVIGVFLAVGHAIYGVALLAGAVAGFVVLRDVPAVYRGRVRG